MSNPSLPLRSPHAVFRRRSARRAGASVRSRPPKLAEFVILSMLLHVLVVTLFGNAPGSGANRGQQLLGALDVTLRRLSPDLGSGIRFAPGLETTESGSARLPLPVPSPPAGTPAAQMPPEFAAPLPSAARASEAVITPAEAAPAAPLAPALPPPAPPPFEALPRLDLEAPEIIDRPLSPRPVAAPAERRPARPAAAPLARIAPEPSSRELAAPIAPPPREVPFAAPAPLPRIAPEPSSRELAAPVAPPPQEVPFTAPAPLPRIAPEPSSRELAAPVAPPPQEVPFTPPAPLERIAPERIQRDLAAPVAPPAAGISMPAPAPRPAADQGSARGDPRTAPAAAQEPPGGAAKAPAGVPAGEAAPRQRLALPDPGDELFRPRGDAEIPAPGAAPRIDLDATRRRAREIAAEGSRSPGFLKLVPPPPPLETKKFDLGEAIAKAAKPDCRDAYAGLGLLAIPPLIAAAIGDGGCRW